FWSEHPLTRLACLRIASRPLPHGRGYRASRTRNIASPRWGEVESECNELSGEGEAAVEHFDPGDLLATASVPGVGLRAGGSHNRCRGVLYGRSAAGRP